MVIILTFISLRRKRYQEKRYHIRGGGEIKTDFNSRKSREKREPQKEEERRDVT